MRIAADRTHVFDADQTRIEFVSRHAGPVTALPLTTRLVWPEHQPGHRGRDRGRVNQDRGHQHHRGDERNRAGSTESGVQKAAAWSAPASTCRTSGCFPYRLLWEEPQVVSVANLTRQGGKEFFDIAEEAGIATETVHYPLAQANEALGDLRSGRLQGAAVLVP